MKAFAKSDVGRTRQVNEDSYCLLQNANGDWLAVVCDGIGGSAAGEVASSMAIKVLRDAFLKAPKLKKDSMVNRWLRENLNKANDSIYLESMRNKKERGMGTTCVGMLYTNKKTYIFNVGDSRVYAYYADGLIQMSEDHSVVARLIKEGKISVEESKHHAQRNTLTNALGIWRAFRIDINRIDSNFKYILVCSDGLHGYVAHEDIAKVIVCDCGVPEKVETLVSMANQAGGYDNCTVILLENEGDSNA